MKLKKAPHFDKQLKQCSTVEDWIVLVGENAHFAYYHNGKEAGKATEWAFIRDVYKFPVDYHPVIIDGKRFDEIDFLQIAPTEQMRIKFFQVGDIPELAKDGDDLKTRILMNLSKHNPKIVAIEWLDQALQGENLYEQLQQIRNGQSTVAEILAANTPKKQDKRQPYIEKRTVNGIDGLYRICPKFDRETGELLSETEQWLSDVVEVVGIGTSEIETFIILRWTPEGQNAPITEAIPLKDLGDREGWKQLRQQGLKIANSSSLRNYLADHLQLSGNRQKWTITHTTGWKNGAYVLPNGEIIGKPELPTLFKGKSASHHGYSTKGTLESWQQEIARNLDGNPSMMLGVACALSAPLIGLIGADSFGVHLYGDSTTGKTTTAMTAISVYGDPELLKLSWFGTTLGILNEGQAHNDNFLPMDEIGQGVNPKYVYETSYALFNGVGKLQGAKDGGNRELARWRTVVFSTGEKDIETYLKMNGIAINAGQLVRLLNVPITRATQYHDFLDGKAHADHLNYASRHHYGVVGRLWIEWLINNKSDVFETYQVVKAKWIARLPTDASPQVQRVANRFAVLETALQLARELTNWSIESNAEAVLHCFNEWVNEFGLHSREEKQVINQVNGFLQRFAGRYIQTPINHDRAEPHDVAGYIIEINEEPHFYTFQQVYLNDVIRGFNEKQANEILFNAGMLKRDKDRRNTQKTPLKYDKKRTRCYVLVPLDESQDDEE